MNTHRIACRFCNNTFEAIFDNLEPEYRFNPKRNEFIETIQKNKTRIVLELKVIKGTPCSHINHWEIINTPSVAQIKRG